MSVEISEPTKSCYYKRVKKNAENFYIKFKLKYEGKPSDIDILAIKSIINNAIVQLHGHSVSALTLDLMRFDKKNMEGILRVPSCGFVQVWSSLTLLNQHEGKACVCHVLQVTPYLLALAGNSREFVIPPPL
ncbi:ribonuclease P protein subunit p14-like [Antedon mediterranea]|uniref:ribonuclease P protein subunit p14-like n=1 Tax=Antedon mediterranea TaxID=105859 RepID=UPI003AF687AF